MASFEFIFRGKVYPNFAQACLAHGFYGEDVVGLLRRIRDKMFVHLNVETDKEELKRETLEYLVQNDGWYTLGRRDINYKRDGIVHVDGYYYKTINHYRRTAINARKLTS